MFDMSTVDNLCDAWTVWAVDKARPEDASLEGRIFSIDVRALFTYPKPEALLDEDGEFDLDSLDEAELQRTHEVPYDSMKKDPQSAVQDMLASMRIPVHSVFVDEISDCAARMSADQHYRDRKVLRMGVRVYVVVGENPFDDEKPASDEEGLETLVMTDGSYDCSVCLDKISKGSEAKRLPDCPHMFHYDCILIWRRTSDFCPGCRSVEIPRE